MPLLDFEQVKTLREAPVKKCPRCGYAEYKSYCRTCDVYCYLGHGHLCTTLYAIRDREHEEHRHY